MKSKGRLGALKPASLAQRFETSLWLYPILFVIVAIGLAFAVSELDRHLPQGGFLFMFSGEPDSARELLSTIASSLISITALVFSITILVLQLASAQFSPRVLQTFLQDRMTQFSMGMFVGSFVYALVLLPRVRDGDSSHDDFVPGLAVFVATLLALISVAVLIRYIHHMAHSIRAVNIMARIADETRCCMERLYPELAQQEAPAPAARMPQGEPDQRFGNSKRSGVLMSVDEAALLELAVERDLVIALAVSVGQFAPQGAPLFAIWGRRSVDERELGKCLRFGAERTPHQDAAFGIRQLVDIAERALSTGVNDPTTAAQALDQIHDLLRALAQRRIPGPYVEDDAGGIRLVLPRLDWESHVRLGIEEISHYGKNSIQIVRRVRALLSDLLSIVPAYRQGVLEEQLAMLDRAAEDGARR